MKKMQCGFFFFHVNTNTISLTSISNRRLKLINTKAAVKQEITVCTAIMLRLNSTQQEQILQVNNRVRNLTTYYFYLTSINKR